MASIRMLARDAVKKVAPTQAKGREMTPVYILAGLVTAAVGLGILTAKQQLLYAPDVHVKKSKRETLPEVVDPDEAAQESDKFINKSVLRKVAHAKDLKNHTSIPQDVRSRKPRVETLKEVGIDLKQL